MAATLGSLIVQARAILQDLTEPYRYPRDQLATYVWDGVAEARRIRPDLYVVSMDVFPPNYALAPDSTTVPIPSTYIPQLVNYIAGRAELRDDSSSVDGRAITLVSSYLQSLKGR